MSTFKRTSKPKWFDWEARRMPYPVWLLLGEASALCERLSDVALPAEQSALLDYASLLRGVLGSTQLDGNTLTEDQVDRLFEGSLVLPPSQEFLGVEVKNLVKAVRWSQDRVKAGDRDTGPDALRSMNVQVLKGLPSGTGRSAGEYRTDPVPGESGIPAQDIPEAMQRLGEWLASPLFLAEEAEERTAFAIVQAVLAHLHLHAIRPFAAGNGRTARLAEFQLLIAAGVPATAAHRLAMHAAATRSEYQRQVAQALQADGDPVHFILYMVRGFVDGLRMLWSEVADIQHQALLDQHTGSLAADPASRNGARQSRLLRDLRGHGGAVPPGRVPHLSPELAHAYARLNPKTLQRDLQALQEQGLVERTAEGVRARPLSLRPFKPLTGRADPR